MRMVTKWKLTRELPAAKHIRVSFSGGRSSALMAMLVHDAYAATHEIHTVFANTGAEHPGTYEFVHDFELFTGIKVVWVEALVHPRHRQPTTHTVRTKDDYSTGGEPFESYISKYGIPNHTNPACTTALKVRPMDSYSESLGLTRKPVPTYYTCIGIRADEMDRVSIDYKQERFVYPLLDVGITRADVMEFWKGQVFDLKLPSSVYGNCVFCYKKSSKKLLTIAKRTPEAFDFPARMERKYGHVNAHMAAGDGNGQRWFYRGGLSTAQLLSDAAAMPDHREFVDADPTMWPEPMATEDSGYGGCGESCEPFADATAPDDDGCDL